MDKEYAKEVGKARREMMKLTTLGAVSAPRAGSQRETAQALQCELFREDVIQWTVLEVERSGKDRTAVVW